MAIVFVPVALFDVANHFLANIERGLGSPPNLTGDYLAMCREALREAWAEV